MIVFTVCEPEYINMSPYNYRSPAVPDYAVTSNEDIDSYQYHKHRLHHASQSDIEFSPENKPILTNFQAGIGVIGCWYNFEIWVKISVDSSITRCQRYSDVVLKNVGSTLAKWRWFEYMDCKSQGRQKSLLTWRMIYVYSRLYFSKSSFIQKIYITKWILCKLWDSRSMYCNVALMSIQRWNMVDKIDNVISTLFSRQKSNVDPI